MSWANDGYRVDRREQATDSFAPYPDIEAEFFSAEDYQTNFTRLWEDATFVSSARQLEAIDGPVLREMMRCGVNLPSVDMLRATDDVHDGHIWSWAPEQPPAGDARPLCAWHREDGRQRGIAQTSRRTTTHAPSWHDALAKNACPPWR